MAGSPDKREQGEMEKPNQMESAVEVGVGAGARREGEGGAKKRGVAQDYEASISEVLYQRDVM